MKRKRSAPGVLDARVARERVSLGICQLRYLYLLTWGSLDVVGNSTPSWDGKRVWEVWWRRVGWVSHTGCTKDYHYRGE